MKTGDVLVEKLSTLTFYTIITDAKYGRGVRVSIDSKGKLYGVAVEAYFAADEGVLLSIPDEMPACGAPAKKEAANV